MRRLILFALLVTACVPTASDPYSQNAVSGSQIQRTEAAQSTRIAAIPITQSYEQLQATQRAIETLAPREATKAWQEAELRNIQITQAWDDATASAAYRYSTQVAMVATSNEAARRDLDAARIYAIEQERKEFDAMFWPVFWRCFWITLVIIGFIVALWLGKAFEKKIRSDADNSRTKFQAEADATRMIAAADARKKRAEAKRLEAIPARDGVYFPDRSGVLQFLPMAHAAQLPPLPPMPRGEPIKVYPKVVADVLDFLDACSPLMGDDPRKLPSAEALNNSTLRDNGLRPLMQAGAIHTAGGRNGGTFILGYADIGALRAAVEAGQVPLPTDAELVAE